ncbi:heme biosynthesis HemY N-terminal domain-containing protein [Neptunicella marina]|uniref:Heme biosynthesis protein HemY n=1 Tax=Neptunicella marina TaxID=2125989 RepID=A0A8J6IVS1_9ALTE|nr:heme biosynthesis HemY N-terminal domain-containing protein [Neptunicella marina]MBC3766488.1 heme biosynthesis protein HemY [Neptunicella marina]
MIRLLLLFVLLIAGLVAGRLLTDQQGYVLIALDNWTIEMSVVTLLSLIVGSMVLFLVAEWLFKKGWRGLGGSLNLVSRWRERRRHSAYINGMIALKEQHLVEAQKYFTRLNSQSLHGVDLLHAADATALLNQTQTSTELWEKALLDPATELAAKLHFIQLHLQEKRFDKALQLLQHLPEKYRQHPTVAQYWCEGLAAKGNWHELKDRLKGWKKILGMESYSQWMQRCSFGVFAEIASKQGAIQLKNVWQALPRSDRKDHAQQAAYVKQLIGQGMHNDAAAALVEFQNHPQPQLLPLYSQLRCKAPAAVIKQLEGWLRKDENNLKLLSALASVAFYSDNFVLAEKVLQKRLGLEADRDDLLLLAKTKEMSGQTQQAMELYKQALNNA